MSDAKRFGRRDFLRGMWDSPEKKPAKAPKPASTFPLGTTPPCLPTRLGESNPCVECAGPCVDVCEPRIIRRHEGPGALAGRAYLDFAEAGCTWCGDCLEVCPVTPPAEDRAPRLGMLLLDHNSCLAHRDILCLACQDVCPQKAIEFDPRGRPSVKTSACDGCGMCVAPCPVDSFRVIAEL